LNSVRHSISISGIERDPYQPYDEDKDNFTVQNFSQFQRGGGGGQSARTL